MNCEFYRSFETGELDAAEFDRHLKDCLHCRTEVKKDAHLMNLASELDQLLETPNRWPRLRKELQAMPAPREKSGIIITWRFLRIAAVLLIGIVLALSPFRGEITAKKGLLGESEIKRVERAEKEFIAAIKDLENLAVERMEPRLGELALLYRDKLATIDRQIGDCREALLNNPGNAHIRKYMLAALSDKKKTLEEMLRQI